MATTKKPAPATRKLTVKKDTLVDLSVKKAGPKGGYTPWTVGGLTDTKVVAVKTK